MRLLKLTGVFAIAAALAACGGGGGGITPQPHPTATPTSAPVTYSAKLVFKGALAGSQSTAIQSDLRQAQSASPMDVAASPIPIMVLSSFETNADTSVYGGEVQAVVSPMPSLSPSTTFTQDNPNAVMQTPTPLPTGATPAPLPSGVLAQATVSGANSTQTQSAGTASAAIGSPVNLTPTTPVYSYMSIALDCQPGPGGVAGGTLGPQYVHHFGWKWDGTTWAPDDDSATADIYIDGDSSSCPLNVNASETGAYVHVPGGDVRISEDTPFSAVSASQWTNAETSFSTTPSYINPDGSMQLLIIGKTRDGAHVFKVFTVHPFLLGAIETSGDSVDGF